MGSVELAVDELILDNIAVVAVVVESEEEKALVDRMSQVEGPMAPFDLLVHWIRLN